MHIRVDSRVPGRVRAGSVRRARQAFAAAVVLVAVVGVGWATPADATGATTTWTQRSPAATPGTLSDAATAYDASTDQLVLFGGIVDADGDLSDATWVWDGTTWTEQNPATSPPAVADASMAYDASTGQIVLFGGADDSGDVFGDTWTWDGTTWTEQSPATSPPARTQAAMDYDSTSGQVLLFGGQDVDGNALGDTWTWDGSTDTWTEQSPTTSPLARYDASLADDPSMSPDTSILFGGIDTNGDIDNDTWTWDGADDTWIELTPASSPPSRALAALAYSPDAQQLLLTGGEDDSGNPLSDTWMWNGTTWTEQAPAASPPARFAASLAFDGSADQLVLFGGTDGTAPLGDTWTFDPIAVPGAPGIGSATGSNGRATVSFAAPSSDGGSPVTAYTVVATDLTDVARGGQTTNGTSSPLTVTGLTNGDTYTFAVTATTAAGPGPASASSNRVVPSTVPGSPPFLTASAGNERATVAFVPPVSDGGSVVTSYTVTAYDVTDFAAGSRTASGSGSPITVSGLRNGDHYVFTVTARNIDGSGPASHVSNPVVPGSQANNGGYWLVASDGGIFDYGDAGFHGSAGGSPLNRPIVGMAPTPDGGGYWLVASDGGIFAYGDAGFHGSAGGSPLNRPIVGMAATPDGGGYWLVASDGGIFAYGDAAFYGSAGGSHLNKPIVGMAATPDGKGYWLVASDGGIFAYGDARFLGSAGGSPLNRPIVGMAATPDGGGYWLVASDGGIFAYGDATFYGSAGGIHLNRPIVGMTTTPDGKGYWLVATDGGIFTYGDARFLGSAGGSPLNKPMVGMG